jgi:prepilin-type N-terminal cleavage/methylation domain-containing protein
MKVLPNRIKKTRRLPAAMTLVEVMTAIAILAMVVLGTGFYRFHSSIDARKANMQNAAARIGLLLSESWRGVKGAADYDPVSHLGSMLAISTESVDSHTYDYCPVAIKPADFTALGTYRVYLNNDEYHAVLSWKNVAAGLRALYTVVVWQPRTNVNYYPYSQGSISMYQLGDPAGELFCLSTYVYY